MKNVKKKYNMKKSFIWGAVTTKSMVFCKHFSIFCDQILKEVVYTFKNKNVSTLCVCVCVCVCVCAVQGTRSIAPWKIAPPGELPPTNCPREDCPPVNCPRDDCTPPLFFQLKFDQKKSLCMT